MYLLVNRTHTAVTVTLEDVDNFLAFKLIFAPPVTLEVGREALTGVAAFDAQGDAHVDVSALRQLSHRGGDLDWNAGLEKMVAYAASVGWAPKDGSTVQAHCEGITSTQCDSRTKDSTDRSTPGR